MTRAPRDPRVYFQDILQAIASIETYVNGMSTTDFAADRKTQDAVVRNLEVIGEAAKRIPEHVRNKHPEIAWHPAAAMRDFLIHDYPEVDVQAVWDTVQSDIPSFKAAVQTLYDAQS